MRNSIVLGVGLLLLGLGSCTENSSSASAPTAGATPTPAPKTELMIYAATSTRDALQSIEPIYEKSAGVELVFNFGSSGDLSKQITSAGKADVFLSADEKEMDKVEAEKLLATGTRVSLLSNQLVVVEPADGASVFTEPFAPVQIADPKITRLSLANVETVPAGRYAKAWLEKVGVWQDVSERVLPAVDVRAALAAVESAGAQAGIVYRTDMVKSKRARVAFAVPMEQGPKISYPVAVLAGRPPEKQARAFVEYIASPAARGAFEELGFVFLPGSKSAPK